MINQYGLAENRKALTFYIHESHICNTPQTGYLHVSQGKLRKKIVAMLAPADAGLNSDS
jgi:hypothetical protein